MKAVAKPTGPEEIDKYIPYFEKILNGAYRPNLILCNMGEDGKGLFTPEEIKNRQVITFMSGELTGVPKPGTTVDKTYGYHDTTTIPLFTPVTKVNGTIIPTALNSDNPFVLNGRKFSNFDSYCQHLPEKESLLDYGIAKEYCNYIACANIKFVSFPYKGIFVILLYIAIEKIKAGTQLGWNYGEQFWKNKHPFTLFNCRGQSIGKIKNGKLQQSEEEFAKKILLVELQSLTAKITDELADAWKYNNERSSAFLKAEETQLMRISTDLNKANIENRIIKYKDGAAHYLFVHRNQHLKLIKLAESEPSISKSHTI
jgi:hypothetical protein